MMKTPPPVSLRVKRKNVRQLRRHLCMNISCSQDTDGSSWKIQSSRREAQHSKMSTSTVIHQQEMTMYFRLFDDELIHSFLRMDFCYKLTDKYLLAMTFVYFKRARFSVAEYTRKNFFIALYLAHTMEEDEEENKYEIFPWALGKNWRRQFPRFLKQRDELWARINYRAAVSRRCCEEVMSIMPSHFVWQRQRSDHHSGAQRQYDGQGTSRFPRGPSASPVSCDLCDVTSHRGSASNHSSARSADTTCQHPLPSGISSEVTPPRAARRTAGERRAGHLCLEELPNVSSSWDSSYDAWIVDWIREM